MWTTWKTITSWRMMTHRLKSRRKSPRRPPNRIRKRKRRKSWRGKLNLSWRRKSSRMLVQSEPTRRSQWQMRWGFISDRNMSLPPSCRLNMYRLFKVTQERNSESKTRTYHNLLTPNCSKLSGPQIGACSLAPPSLRSRWKTCRCRHLNFRNQRSSSSRISRHQTQHR